MREDPSLPIELSAEPLVVDALYLADQVAGFELKEKLEVIA